MRPTPRRPSPSPVCDSLPLLYADHLLTFSVKPTSLRSRLTTRLWPASASTLLPTTFTGLWPRVTLARFPYAFLPHLDMTTLTHPKARRNAMENASKNAGEMINKYVYPSLQSRACSNNLIGSRSCTTVSVKPPLPVNWLRLSPVPPPPRTCRSLILQDEVAFGVDLLISRSTPCQCKISVNPFQFLLCLGEWHSV